MGYNPTVKSIQKVRTYLDAMVISEESLTWLVTDPRKLAYQIHEALKAAEELKFSAYASLRKKWMIRYRKERSGGKVIAELQDSTPLASGTLTFEDVFDPLDIVQTVIKHKIMEFELYFPNASLAEEDYNLVLAWCNDNNYTCDISNQIQNHKQIGMLIKPNGNTQAS
jgi:hypothetical protein